MIRTFKLLFLLAGCLFAGEVYSQVGNPGDASGRRGEPGGKADGEKRVSPKDTIPFKMVVSQFSNGYSQLKETKKDTSFYNYQNFRPEYKTSITAQTIGNFGSFAQSNDYFQRSFDPDEFLFLKNVQCFGLWQKDIRFYNTTKPFTLLEYGQWFGNQTYSEAWLNVEHTQNINPSLNFGFTYKSLSSDGQYLNQSTKDNSLSFFSSYNVDRYDLWFTIGKNKFSGDENGGLLYPEDTQNPDLNPENIQVWFDATSYQMKNTFGVLSHQYKFGKWIEKKDKDETFQQFIPRFSLMHTLEFTDNSRIFTEVEPNPYYDFGGSTGVVYYYGTDHSPYIKSTTGTTSVPSTQDHTGMSRISNLFYLKAIEAPDRKYTFGKQAYIGNDLNKVYYPREELIYTPGVMMPPLGLTQSKHFTNTFVGGSIYRSEGKVWDWNIKGRYYIQGRRAADYSLDATIEKPLRTRKDTSFLKINGSLTNTTPDYFYENYYSNHFKWSNNFDKIVEFKVGASYDNSHRKFKAGFKYSIIQNYVYYNESSLPDQASSEFSVAQLYFKKDFKFGVLNLQHEFQLQKSSTDVYMHVPLLSARNTIFIQGVYAKVLTFQLGMDVRYDTKYYADYYSPALGMFYVQHNEKLGDYPWMDAFVNLKIKRTRFYVKYSNMGSMSNNGKYFLTPGYAAQVAKASFGLSWTFYD